MFYADLTASRATTMAQRTFLLSVSIIEFTLAALSLFNHELAIADGCIVSVTSLSAFFAVTSVVFGHLAYDLNSKGLYRVGLWTFLAQLLLITGLHRYGQIALHGLVVAAVAAVGFAWLTATYRRNLYDNVTLVGVEVMQDVVVVLEEKTASGSPRRGRSRTPRGSQRKGNKSE